MNCHPWGVRCGTCDRCYQLLKPTALRQHPNGWMVPEAGPNPFTEYDRAGAPLPEKSAEQSQVIPFPFADGRGRR